MKKLGTWWNDSSIEIVEVNGTAYALNGWNGEVYTSCWICSGDFLMTASKEEYTLKPIYRFEAENIDMSRIEEGSDEWDKAVEIVDYDASRN